MRTFGRIAWKLRGVNWILEIYFGCKHTVSNEISFAAPVVI